MTTLSQPVPVIFPAGDGELFGLLHENGAGGGVGAVVLPGLDNVGLGRYRLVSRLTRRLSDHGLTVLRVDVRGTGDSSGGVVRVSAGRPFVADVEAGVRVLRERGVDRTVLVGFCYGARAALAAAASVPSLAAVVLLAPMVSTARSAARTAQQLTGRGLLRRVLNPSAWFALRRSGQRRHVRDVVRFVFRLRRARRHAPTGQRSAAVASDAPDRDFVDALAGLAARGVPTLVVYGEADAALADFEYAREGPLGEVLSPDTSVEIRVLGGELHHHQKDSRTAAAAIEATSEWLASSLPRARKPSVPGGS